MAQDYTFTYPDGSPGSIDGSLPRDQAMAEKARLVAQWKTGQGSTTDDALGPALEGVTGGFLDEASGVLGALIGKMRGTTLAEGYQRGYEGSKGRRERFATAHPVASTALEVGGTLAGFGLAPELKAAQALGVGGRLAPRVVNAAATGAGYGALAGAGYAESPEGPASTPGEVIGSTLAGAGAGALVGGLTGGATEGLVAGVGGGLRAARRGLLGDVTRGDVERTIGRNIRREHGGTVDDLVAEMQGLQDQGYPVVVGDMGGVRTRRMARAAADVSPEAQATLEGVTGPRYTGQGGRTEAAIERASGGVGVETRFGIQDTIRQAQRERGVLYDDAYAAGAPGIPWTPAMVGLAQDEPIFQHAMRQGARNLELANNAARAEGGREWALVGSQGGPEGSLGGRGGSGPRASLAYWDQVKRVLDERVNRAQDAGRNQDALHSGRIRDVLREHLTATVPEYQRALGVFHQLFGGRDAGEAGAIAFTRNLPDVQLERVLGDLTESEQRLFRASWISKLQEKVTGVKDRQNMVDQIAASPKATRQMRVMLGPEGTQQLIAHRNVEQTLHRLHQEVTGNSKTARYAVGIGAGIGGVGGAALSGGNLTDPRTWLGAAVGAAAGIGLPRARAMLAGAVNERAAQWIAHALTSGDPELLRRIAIAAQRNPQIQQAISRFTRAAMGAGVGAYGATQE